MELEEIQAALPERYRVIRELGRGGMAVVYLAEDVPHERSVAIKVMSPELGSSIDGERFKREIKIAAQLSHPNILTAYDSGAVGKLLYYVMPYIGGESLRGRMKREGQLSIEDAIGITCEVADALEYAHSQGVIHRDIKPENILLQSGHAVVADFGIARMVEDAGNSKLTQTGASIGTASYMSPEQFSGLPVDFKTDQYALACVLYEMLVGEVPFTGPNAMAIMARVTMQEVPSVRMVRQSVPEDIEAAIFQALEKTPADRFASVGTFKDALLGAQGANTYVRQTRAYTAAYRATQQVDRRRMTPRRMAIGAATAAVVLAAGVVGAKQYWPSSANAASLDANANHIGVLYFSDESKNSDLRFLADGLTESLINQLSEISAIDVVSADGVRPYRGSAVSPDSISRALNVGKVVRGSIAQDGGTIKVTVQLLDALSEADLGTTTIRLDTANMAQLQRTVADSVVDFLREKIGTQVRLLAQKRATSNNDAWLLIQRAEKRRKDADSLRLAHDAPGAASAFAQADSFLLRAEMLDKKSAEAATVRAGLALARAQAMKEGAKERNAVVDSGLAFASRALTIDPRNPNALQYRGELLFFQYTRQLIADQARSDQLLILAESSLTKATEVNKDHAGAWAALSALHARQLELVKANLAALNAYRADAYLSSAKTILTRLFSTSYNLEAFPEARKWCDEGRRRFPREPYFVQCRLMMYLAKAEKPNVDSAWTYARQYAGMFPDSARALHKKRAEVFVAGALVNAELPDSAKRVLDRTRATPLEDPRHEVQGYEVVVRVMLGQQDEAVDLIEDYLTANPDHKKGFTVRTVWWWRDLQTNKKFQRMIASAR